MDLCNNTYFLATVYISSTVLIYVTRGGIGCSISSFICLSADAVELIFLTATTLLHNAPSKVTSVLVLCYFWRFISVD